MAEVINTPKGLFKPQLATMHDMQRFTTLDEIRKEIIEYKNTGFHVPTVLVGQSLLDDIIEDLKPSLPDGKRVQFISIEGARMVASPLCGPYKYSIQKIKLQEN